MNADLARNLILNAHSDAAYFGAFGPDNGYTAQDRERLKQAVHALATATFESGSGGGGTGSTRPAKAGPSGDKPGEADSAPKASEDCGCPPQTQPTTDPAQAPKE